MKIEDLFEETFLAITVNKARTGLTMLGIVIGIAAVIALTAIGQGAQGMIQASIQSLGSNLLIIVPGASKTFGSTVSAGLGSAETLTPDDANAISQLPGVAAVSPEASGRYQVIHGGSNTQTNVLGVVSSYPQVRDVQVAQGRFITDSDNRSSARTAVIGPTVLQDIFGSSIATATPDMAIGQTIRIKNVDFTVVGVTQSKGGSGFNNQDDMIFIPLSVAQHFLIGSSQYLSEVDVEAQSQQVMAQVQSEITSLLLRRHNISNPQNTDFNVINQADIISAASFVTGTFTTLLAAIAGISLLVGGIGIMNMMLTTVTERTREIGLRKAVGAKRKDITMQFLTEAVMLTFGGGIIGIAVGWIAATAVSSLTSITTIVSPSSILLAFCVSAGIGILFGYYPAVRAARLNPIEALRYE